MEDFRERRKFVRLNALVDVVYSKISHPIEELTLTKNISKGGLCLIAYEELKKNDVLNLNIYLPEDKNPIQAKGKVVWSKQFLIGAASRGKRYDVGVVFLDIKDEDLGKIGKYVFTNTLD